MQATSEANKPDLSTISPALGIEILADAGFVVGVRDPDIKPGVPGAYMVLDVSADETGYCLLGDDKDELVKEALAYQVDKLDISVTREISDERLLSNEFGITAKSIGSVEVEAGNDLYYLVTRCDGEELEPELAQRWLLLQVYLDTEHPGGVFCHTVSAAQKPFSDTECICIAHYRINA